MMEKLNCMSNLLVLYKISPVGSIKQSILVDTDLNNACKKGKAL